MNQQTLLTVIAFFFVAIVVIFILWLIRRHSKFYSQLPKVSEFLMQTDRNSEQAATKAGAMIDDLQSFVFDDKSDREVYGLLAIWKAKFKHLYSSNYQPKKRAW